MTMKVTGILSISNGDGLQYPYPPVIASLANMCEDVVVGLDPNFPEDVATVEALGLENVQVVLAPWDSENRTGGTEIAIQMDALVDVAKKQGSDWVVVMQADELLHEKDFEMLRMFMVRSPRVTGFKMNRLYFWKDLDTVRTDWNAELVRIFRPGTYSFMAENTDKSGMFSAQTSPGEEVTLPYFIYHYSRVDAPEVISLRVRNLDALFHPEEALIEVGELPPYDFVPRIHDNFAKDGFPEEVEGKFEAFTDTHPRGMKEWYCDQR